MNSKLKLSVTLRGIVAESYDHAEEQAREVLGKLAQVMDSGLFFSEHTVRIARETTGTFTATVP